MGNKTKTMYHQGDGEFVVYYCAINEPIAEIVILEYFTKFSKVEKINNLFADDFSVNYKIGIPASMVDDQCLLCLMFMRRHITPPATFGVVLSDIFNMYNLIGRRTCVEEVFQISIDNYKKKNPNATIEELDKFESKGRRLIESRGKYDKDVDNVIDILKSRLGSDKCKFIEKYCKTYPLQVIGKDRYYVTHVSGKCIEQYIGDKCSKYLYYYMFDNQKKYEKEYGKVLLNMKEQGLFKARWKNEFSLYILVKSYFSSAIYQYHSEWLEKQSLDIYIPEYKIGIEYQGIQHYEEVDIFNGTGGLMETQMRDKKKKEKCKLNGVTLIEWMYTDKIEDKIFIDVLNELKIPIPQKQDMTIFHKDDMSNLNVGNRGILKRELPRVCQYDLEGNYLDSYESVVIAANVTGVSEESIRRVCSGIRNTGGGYMWRRYYEDEIPHNIGAYSNEEQIRGPRKILQYSVEGETIASYDSVSEAARQTGINPKSIRETAKGKQNHAGGYVWKYAPSN